MRNYDFLTFIGRFQYFHNGHFGVITQALDHSEKVIILIGSSFRSPTVRNPFSFEERKAVIRACFPNDKDRLIILPLIDTIEDKHWIRRVQEITHGVISQFHPVIGRKEPRVGLIGHSKDQSSYYLSLFPKWGSVNVANIANLSSTPFREAFLVDGTVDTENTPEAAVGLYESFKETGKFDFLVEEAGFVRWYRQKWANSPYEPVFVTADAVVVQSGHVLLVRRGARPGKGLLALPGGYVNSKERVGDAMLRELQEETSIKKAPGELRGSIVRKHVYDDPYRSDRGRIITHAYYLELNPSHELPKIKGNDDAADAIWVPMVEVNPEEMFEDHYQIIEHITG